MRFNDRIKLIDMLQQLQDYIAQISQLAQQINCEVCDDYECEEREECKRDKWIMFLQWLKQNIYNN